MGDDRQPDPMQGFYQRTTPPDGPRPPWWEIRAAKWGEAFTRVRLPIAGVAAAGLLIFFAWVSSGRGIFIFLVLAWWLGPFVLYLFFINSRIGSVVLGVLLLLATFGELLWVLDVMETSSTGALGFLTLPVFTYPAMGLAIVLDRFLVLREDHQHPTGSRLILTVGSVVIALGTTFVLWGASEKVQSGLAICCDPSGSTVAFADSAGEAVDLAVEELGFVWPGTTIQDEAGPAGTINVERHWLGLLEAEAQVVPSAGRFAIESESYRFGLGNSVQLLLVTLLGAITGILVWKLGRRTAQHSPPGRIDAAARPE